MFFLSGFQEAMNKDTIDRVNEPNLNLRRYLQNAYIHPVFKDDGSDDYYDDGSVIIPTKRQFLRNEPEPSRKSDGSSPLIPVIIQEKHKPWMNFYKGIAWRDIL